MIKKLLIVSSVFLLLSCGTESTSTPQPDEEPVDETSEMEDTTSGMEETEDITEKEAAEFSQTNADITLLSNLVNEKTFVDDYALQAWDDYQEIASNIIYGDAALILEETSDFSDLSGTSIEETDGLTTSMGLREDVYKETVEINEREEMHFFRYPAEEGSEFSGTSDFLAELSFYYLEDHLIFSSITPGFFSVELNDLPDAEQMTTFLSLDEIEALNPQVFTIAEMNISGNLIRQIMIPAMHINEEGNEEVLAFYFFTSNDNILYYASLPFEMVMQSFPDYSILIYQELLPVLSDLTI